MIKKLNKEVNICPNGHVGSRNSKYCEEDGEKLSLKIAEHLMICPVCGKLYADCDYCDEDGEILEIIL